MDLKAIDWQRLLTSFEGRIDRMEFWVGYGVTLLLAIVAGYVGVLIGSAIPFVGGLIALLIGVASLYPLAAVAMKRLHDRDKPEWWLAVYLGPSVLSLALSALGLTLAMSFGFLAVLVSLASLAAFVYMAYDLGYLAGTPVPNAHGAPPTAQTQTRAA